MKLIILSIVILIFYYFMSSTEETYAITVDNIFSKVEIPDASKDPYYQKIKNMTFDCGIKCPDGHKVGSNGSCVCINDNEESINGVCKCKAGLTRELDGKCYSSCPSEQVRDANGDCVWIPCPDGQSRNLGGDNKCYYPCDDFGYIYAQQYRDANGVCQWLPCRNGGTRRTSDGACIVNCGSGQFMNNNGQCQCIAGLVPIGDNSFCYNPETAWFSPQNYSNEMDTYWMTNADYRGGW